MYDGEGKNNKTDAAFKVHRYNYTYDTIIPNHTYKYISTI